MLIYFGDKTFISKMKFSAGCSSRIPWSGSQHPRDASQPSVTPVPGVLVTFSHPHRHQAPNRYTDIQAGKILKMYTITKTKY